MSMSIPFEQGQIFVSVDPRDEGRRVKILRVPTPSSYRYSGDPYVATITEDGREIRHRYISGNQFHDSKWTQNSTVRVTGYILESAL